MKKNPFTLSSMQRSLLKYDIKDTGRFLPELKNTQKKKKKF